MPKPKLLLADDSITIQKVVNLTFADHGMDVFPFPDGDKAIELFDEIKPDIVLADVHMPGLNGYQLCELLKSDAASRDIPVVLLVGSFEPFDKAEAERVGADAHLTKPFSSIADLVSTVEGLLQRPAAATYAEETANGDAGPVSREPHPDTGDIDKLYEQSFLETVEIPQEGTFDIEYEPDGIDDEMIQTSYAAPDTAPVVDESIYTEDAPGDITGLVHEPERVDEDALSEEPIYAEVIAEPQDEPSRHHETVPSDEELSISELTTDPRIEFEADASSDRPGEAGDGRDGDTLDLPAAAADLPTETTGSNRDPFAAVAADLPSDAGADTVKFAFDDLDLLELPETTSPRRVEYTAPGAPAANGREAVSLSPELIELIVQKVIERLEHKK